MNRKLLKVTVEAVTGRSDVIAYVAETLGISVSSAAMKLRGDSPLSISQTRTLCKELKMTPETFTKIFLED